MFFDNDILLVSLSNLNTDPHPFKLMHKTSDAWKLCSTKRQVSIHNHIARILRLGARQTDKSAPNYLNLIKRPVLWSNSDHSALTIFSCLINKRMLAPLQLTSRQIQSPQLIYACKKRKKMDGSVSTGGHHTLYLKKRNCLLAFWPKKDSVCCCLLTF